MWTCTEVEGGVEILRYNGNATDIIVPSVIAGKPVVMLNSTFDGFYGCEGLEKVSLPNSIVDMNWAFNSCYSLKEIDFPTNVKDISWALQSVNIRHIVFPQGVEHLASVMPGTDSVESVFIPKTVKCLSENIQM